MFKILFLITLFLSPYITQAVTFFGESKNFLNSFGGLVNIATPIVVGLALLYFFWGLAQFIAKSGSSDSHEEGRNKMIWGVVALFVMVTIWGIVFFVAGELGLNYTSAPGASELSPLNNKQSKSNQTSPQPNYCDTPDCANSYEPNYCDTPDCATFYQETESNQP